MPPLRFLCGGRHFQQRGPQRAVPLGGRSRPCERVSVLPRSAMSSEPTRASLLRALFKMEPAASEVLGGASEFVKGESEPGALPVPRSRGLCCGASLGSLFFFSSHRSARLAASVGSFCFAVLVSRLPCCCCGERLSSFSSAAVWGGAGRHLLLSGAVPGTRGGSRRGPAQREPRGQAGPLCATRPSAVFQIASTSLLCGISPKVR